MTQESKASKSGKRYTLLRLATGWRESIFHSIHSQRLKTAVAVLTATGCRPSELERGVAVRYIDGQLSIGIQGSKVDEHTGRGQPLRLIYVDPCSVWGAYLVEQASTQPYTQMVVHYDAGGISQRLREKSRELWPRRMTLVSAYSYRHFLAKSLKESGEDPSRIAQILGHSSDFSQTAYGRAGKAKRTAGLHGVINAHATNPIRHSSKSDRVSNLYINAEANSLRK